jgi:site-specific recombinase XerD
VWTRKNKQGKIIGYRASYWVDTPSGPKRRYVFASQTGKTMSASNVVNRHSRPLLKRARLPRTRLHDLRHTCATMLLLKGVHLKYVQELLGHANTSTTLDTYSHVIPGMGNQTVNAMEEIFT